jgi:hypothetical protein
VQDQTYEYRVAAVDTNSTEGVKSASDSADILSAFLLKDTLISLGASLGTFALDNRGNIYLTNLSSSKIEVFDSTGNKIRDWAAAGSLDKSPNGFYNNLSLGPNNGIYVYTYYDLISVYDTLGTLTKSFGSSMSSCEGMVFYKDSIFIAVEQATPGRKILVFDSTGSEIGIINHDWDIADDFYSLVGDSGGNLFLYGLLGTTASDRKNKVEVISEHGIYSRTLSLAPYPPRGTLEISTGKFIITSRSSLTSNSQIYCYNMNGDFVSRFTVPSPARKAIFDTNGDLLVAFVNGNIVRYFWF